CDHSMMSIFSPRSSRLMTWIRVPRRPTQAPMGSTSRLVEATATFPLARLAGGRLHDHDPFLDLGDLGLEEPSEIPGMRPRQRDLRALRRATHLEHEGAHAIARVVALAG